MIYVIAEEARSASYVAQQFHIVWVKDASAEFFNPRQLHIPATYHSAFAKRIYLYCEASALRVLLTENLRDSRYEELLQEFEKLLFGPEPTTKALAKLHLIKSAMGNLERLINEGADHSLSWCREWFQNIGYDETNPAVLVTFAQLLALNTKSLRDAISDIGPPVKREDWKAIQSLTDFLRIFRTGSEQHSI